MKKRLLIALAAVGAMIALAGAPATAVEPTRSTTDSSDVAPNLTQCSYEVISSGLNFRTRPDTSAPSEFYASKGFTIHGYCESVSGGTYTDCTGGSSTYWRESKSGWYFARECVKFLGTGWK
ncbi:hypothetical protein [Salininema proteolyticum]|uniref:Uncharacterized protein n=1 Tax=Salininema proteolyticum TaxID=1607685 RepID=A0ABV8TX09_9ACTN